MQNLLASVEAHPKNFTGSLIADLYCIAIVRPFGYVSLYRHCARAALSGEGTLRANENALQTTDGKKREGQNGRGCLGFAALRRWLDPQIHGGDCQP